MKKEEKITKECINCGKSTFIPLFYNTDYVTREVFLIEKCKNCALVRTNGNQKVSTKHYPPEYYGKNGVRFNKLIERLIRSSRIQRARLVEQYSRNIGRILDIGCGRGIMLHFLQKRGWQVVGTELDKELAKSISATYQMEIINEKSLSKCGFKVASFDVVSMFHVLEHMEDPVELLIQVEHILKKTGILIIEVPNFSSWQQRITKGKSFSLDCPRHLFHFTTQTLPLFLSSHGFEVVYLKTSSLEYGYFIFIQSILNLVTRNMNVLFLLLKKEWGICKFYSLDIMLTLILLPMVFLISVPFEFAASLFGGGGVIRVVAEKRVKV